MSGKSRCNWLTIPRKTRCRRFNNYSYSMGRTWTGGCGRQGVGGASTIHNYSGYARGAAQIPHVNTIIDKSRPNSSTIHNSAGYAGDAARIPLANAIKNKSCPFLTTNIHNSSGYAGGAAQISHVNTINGKSRFDHKHPQFFRMPEALPKFHMWTQLMTSLVPIRPQTSTILQDTPEALPKFNMWMQ